MSDDDNRSPEEISNEQVQSALEQKDVDVIRAYKNTFEEGQGQKVLLDMAKCNFYINSSFHNDPLIMAYNEGRRAVLLDILKILGKNETDTINFYKRSKNNDEGYFT